jgi:hypothetical protein
MLHPSLNQPPERVELMKARCNGKSDVLTTSRNENRPPFCEVDVRFPGRLKPRRVRLPTSGWRAKIKTKETSTFPSGQALLPSTSLKPLDSNGARPRTAASRVPRGCGNQASGVGPFGAGRHERPNSQTASRSGFRVRECATSELKTAFPDGLQRGCSR